MWDAQRSLYDNETVEKKLVSELKLSKRERRERYRCGSKYLTLDKINPWFVDLVGFQKIEQSPPIQPLCKPNIFINRILSHFTGNICTLEIDAIVNAANEAMLGGGGIDGAIHTAAGNNLYYECKCIPFDPETGDRCNCGDSKITLGYNLPAKFVIHTVGPRGEKSDLLKKCYSSILQCVKENKIRSVALCGISTGIFGYPLENASRIACETVRQWLEDESNRNCVDRIIFVTFLDKERICYQRLLQEYFPFEEDIEYNKLWHDNPASFVERDEKEPIHFVAEQVSVVVACDKPETVSEKQLLVQLVETGSSLTTAHEDQMVPVPLDDIMKQLSLDDNSQKKTNVDTKTV